MTDDSGEKLQKVLARRGAGSRRAAEELIDDGKVLVNGKKAKTGARVKDGDNISFQKGKKDKDGNSDKDGNFDKGDKGGKGKRGRFDDDNGHRSKGKKPYRAKDSRGGRFDNDRGHRGKGGKDDDDGRRRFDNPRRGGRREGFDDSDNRRHSRYGQSGQSFRGGRDDNKRPRYRNDEDNRGRGGYRNNDDNRGRPYRGDNFGRGGRDDFRRDDNNRYRKDGESRNYRGNDKRGGYDNKRGNDNKRGGYHNKGGGRHYGNDDNRRNDNFRGNDNFRRRDNRDNHRDNHRDNNRRDNYRDNKPREGRGDDYKPRPRQPQILIYNKPPGTVVSRVPLTEGGKEAARPVFDDLPPIRNGRWLSIGRLDVNTEGLLLFIDDGDAANKIAHPRYGIRREYLARVSGALSAAEQKRMTSGIVDEGETLQADEVAPLGEERDGEEKETGRNKWYRLIMSSGKYRAVRRMFAFFGLRVSRLKRVRMGPFVLPRDLPPGEFVFADIGLLAGEDVVKVGEHRPLPNAANAESFDDDGSDAATDNNGDNNIDNNIDNAEDVGNAEDADNAKDTGAAINKDAGEQATAKDKDEGEDGGGNNDNNDNNDK